MAERERKNWRELCHAALGPRDPDELLKTVQELNHALSANEASAQVKCGELRN